MQNTSTFPYFGSNFTLVQIKKELLHYRQTGIIGTCHDSTGYCVRRCYFDDNRQCGKDALLRTATPTN